MYDTFQCNYNTYYKILKEKEEMFAVYQINSGVKTLITHRETLKQAQKIAKLLSEAYKQGYDDGSE